VECQALVLVPTRELAEENARVLHALGEYLGVKAHGCIGGTSVVNDRRIVENGVHVVLGTPGHIFDLLQSSRSRRQFLRTEFIKMLVLDDTDKLLSAFKEQVRYFVSCSLLSSYTFDYCIVIILVYSLYPKLGTIFHIYTSSI
jgi:translation initiation factor 4A